MANHDKKVNVELVKLLLAKAREEQKLVVQWSRSIWNDGWIENMLEHYNKMDAYLSLAEVEDCGSTGGFSKGQPHSFNRLINLEWLEVKYERIK